MLIIFRTIFLVLLLLISFVLTVMFFMFYMPGNVQYTSPSPLAEEEKLTLQRLRNHVIFLSDVVGERHHLAPNSLERAGDYITSQFESVGYEVTPQVFGKPGDDFKNIIAEIKGFDKEPGLIILGAHYDTISMTLGADDNASGVAVLLELARILKDQVLDHTIRFVAFTNEESPFYGSDFMGSKVYVQSLGTDKKNVLGMISLEMLGYFSDEAGSQKYPWPLSWIYPNKGSFIGFVGNLQSRSWLHAAIAAFRQGNGFPSEGLTAPVSLVPDIARSDQISFWQEGIPAFMLTDTANFRNPNYHSANDIYETLDYEKMASLTTNLSFMLLKLANSPE